MSGRPIEEGEPTGVDADGAMIRTFDDVVLLRALAVTQAGNCEPPPAEIPAGTRAMAIGVADGAFELECYLDGDLFAFAEGAADDIRLVLRAEDKKQVEI